MHSSSPGWCRKTELCVVETVCGWGEWRAGSGRFIDRDPQERDLLFRPGKGHEEEKQHNCNGQHTRFECSQPCRPRKMPPDPAVHQPLTTRSGVPADFGVADTNSPHQIQRSVEPHRGWQVVIVSRFFEIAGSAGNGVGVTTQSSFGVTI